MNVAQGGMRALEQIWNGNYFGGGGSENSEAKG